MDRFLRGMASTANPQLLSGGSTRFLQWSRSQEFEFLWGSVTILRDQAGLDGADGWEGKRTWLTFVFEIALRWRSKQAINPSFSEVRFLGNVSKFGYIWKVLRDTVLCVEITEVVEIDVACLKEFHLV